MNAAMAGGTARRLLAQNVRILRLMRGWSQEALAEAAELDRSYVGDIEQARRNVSLDSVERLARAFGMVVPDLLREPDPTELGAQLLRRFSSDIGKGNNGP
jgi:transcriptional regulator with XRE-family HTH domain